MAPPKTDIRATPSVYATAAQSTAHPSSHWPHSGSPDWHLPQPSPSPPPQRSPSETTELKRKLYDIFPDQKQRIDHILSDNPYMRDLNALSGLLLGWHTFTPKIAVPLSCAWRSQGFCIIKEYHDGKALLRAFVCSRDFVQAFICSISKFRLWYPGPSTASTKT